MYSVKFCLKLWKTVLTSKRRNINLSVQSRSLPKEENARHRTVSFSFSGNFSSRPRVQRTLLPVDLVTSDEGSPPETFGVMAVTVLFYSPLKWAGMP